MSITSTCLAEIDRTPLPADVAPLLTSAYVDDSQQLPDMFCLRFRDPARMVLAKTSAKIGSLVKISVQTADSSPPEPLIFGEVTALEAEYDTGGTFTVIRGYDQTHRFFRGRRTVSYQQMTASDIATAIAQRSGLQVGQVTATSTVFPHLGQAGQTDWEVLSGLARANNLEVAVREGSFSFGPPAVASGAPAAAGTAQSDPLVLRLGQDLLRFRSVVTAAHQVKEVEVRGWDVATKQALTATERPATTRVELPTVTPGDLAAAFGNPVHVASDVPYGTQAEVDTAVKTLADEVASAFAELEGVARGNPKLRAGAAVTLDGLGAPFDGKYTVTTSRHRFDPTTGYTTSFAVTGRQDRTLVGLTSGGGATSGSGTRAPAGVVIGQVSDAADPEHAGRVRLTFPWLSADYVSDWARTVQAGAGKNRGLELVPEVGDEVLVAFEQGDINHPVVLGGLHNGIDVLPAGPGDLVDGGNGQVNRRSLVSRTGHRLDLMDSGGHDGVQLVTGNDQLKLLLDSTGTTITVHADGKVKIEGSQGITVDAAGSPLELKGSQISLTATTGLSLDGGAQCSISAALVKIN